MNQASSTDRTSSRCPPACITPFSTSSTWTMTSGIFLKCMRALTETLYPRPALAAGNGNCPAPMSR